MVIAVGGGSCGGIATHYNRNEYSASMCGGECGVVETKILQIVRDTKVRINIGKCGTSKSVNNHYDKILNGSDTSVTFDLEIIVAQGGRYRIDGTSITKYDRNNPYHHRSF